MSSFSSYFENTEFPIIWYKCNHPFRNTILNFNKLGSDLIITGNLKIISVMKLVVTILFLFIIQYLWKLYLPVHFYGYTSGIISLPYCIVLYCIVLSRFCHFWHTSFWPTSTGIPSPLPSDRIDARHLTIIILTLFNPVNIPCLSMLSMVDGYNDVLQQRFMLYHRLLMERVASGSD